MRSVIVGRDKINIIIYCKYTIIMMCTGCLRSLLDFYGTSDMEWIHFNMIS